MKKLNSILKCSLVVLSISVFSNCTSPESNNTGSENVEKPAPKVDTINIVQMKYSPADLLVHPGDTVIWINNDMVAHDVTEQKSNAWQSPMLQPGQSWKMAVSKNEDYFCSIHKVMTGKLIVE